MMSHP